MQKNIIIRKINKKELKLIIFKVKYNDIKKLISVFI